MGKSLVVSLLQFHLTLLLLPVAIADFIYSKDLCPDPISSPNSNSMDIVNQLSISVVSPLYIFDDYGRKIKTCYYEPTGQINGATPKYSVTIRYIRLSIRPWSRNNNLTCKQHFLQIGQSEENYSNTCTTRQTSSTWFKWGLAGPPAASYNVISRGLIASFPEQTSYNYLQIYFSIFAQLYSDGTFIATFCKPYAENLDVWRIQQYAIRKTDCDKYIPNYPVCVDYSYILDPEKISTAEGFSGIEMNEGEETVHNDIVWSREICLALLGTFSKRFQNSKSKDHINYQTVYDIFPSSENNRCIFESEENKKGHKDIITVKGIYSSASLNWNAFSRGLSQCPEFIQFSPRNTSNLKLTKLCGLPETTVSNINYNPSIWVKGFGELGFSYATFPNQRSRPSSALHEKFYIFLSHKTKFKCTLRIQKYEKACQFEGNREHCRSYGDCSTETERNIWSTIILENIQHQYSDGEYVNDQGSQTSDSSDSSDSSNLVSVAVGKFVAFLSLCLLVSVVVFCSCKRRVDNYHTDDDSSIPITSIRRQFPLGRHPIRNSINESQTLPTSNAVADDMDFSLTPTAPSIIDDGGSRTVDNNATNQFEINASVQNPPPYEICSDGLPTYSEATS